MIYGLFTSSICLGDPPRGVGENSFSLLPSVSSLPRRQGGDGWGCLSGPLRRPLESEASFLPASGHLSRPENSLCLWHTEARGICRRTSLPSSEHSASDLPGCGSELGKNGGTKAQMG